MFTCKRYIFLSLGVPHAHPSSSTARVRRRHAHTPRRSPEEETGRKNRFVYFEKTQSYKHTTRTFRFSTYKKSILLHVKKSKAYKHTTQKDRCVTCLNMMCLYVKDISF